MFKNHFSHYAQPCIVEHMEDKAKAFLRSQLQAGKRFDEARIEMISQGYGTQGYNEAFSEIANELGIKEQPPKKIEGYQSTIIEKSEPIVWPNILTMLGHGFGLVFRHFKSILVATILSSMVFVLFLALPFIQATQFLSGTAYALGVVLLIVCCAFLSVVSISALFYTLAHDSEDTIYIQGLQWAYSNFLSIIWLGLLILAITFAGMLALIVPGIAFLIYSVFSFIVAAKENQKGIAAIVRSTDLVMDKFWAIALRLLLLALVFIPAAALVTVLLNLLSSAVSSLPTAGLILLLLGVFIYLLFSTIIFGSLVTLYNARVKEKTFFDYSSYGSLKWSYLLMAFLGFLIPVGVIVVGGLATINVLGGYINDLVEKNSSYQPYPTEQNDGGENFEDYIIEARMDTAFVAAVRYQSRILTYEGVCNDVLVEAPAKCHSTEDTFVLVAPLNSGQYYCRDSAGFKGYIEKMTTSPTSCR